MLKPILFFLAFFPLIQQVSAEEFLIPDTSQVNCYYLYKFQRDSNYQNSVNTQEMVLQIGRFCSKYTTNSELFADSLYFLHKDETPVVAAKAIWPLISGDHEDIFARCEIFKNYPQRNTINTFGYLNKTELQTTEHQPFDWHIVNNDSIIMGYHCISATTHYAGRSYTAWFSPDFPISDGPYKFCGLPGLIFKISDNQNEHSFQLTAITQHPNQPIIFIKNRKVLKCSPEQYTKALYQDIHKLYNRIQTNSQNISSSDEAKAKALNHLKEHNNYIERY